MLSKFKWANTIVLLLVTGVLLAGCGGGSSPTAKFIGGGDEPPGIVGNIGDSGTGGEGGTGSSGGVVDGGGQSGQSTTPGLQPIQGQLGSAPLGTNPEYDVQDAQSIIETHKVSSVSSAGKGASADNPLNWVAITLHGQDPVPGNATGPFFEGDKVDLYMNYNVAPGELTIERTWFIEACGLNFTDSYTHPEPGTYEAIFPFYLPYGSASLEAEFIGAVSLPKVPSVFLVVGYDGTRSVKFDIQYVPVLEPVYHPTEFPPDNGGPHACMPDWGSLIVYPDLHVESTDKDLGNVVYIFDKTGNDVKGDEVAVKFAGLTGLYLDPATDGGKHYDGPWPPDNPNVGQEPFVVPDDVTVVFVKAGCNSSGFGPGYGWRYDAPFGTDNNPDTNKIPTAQIVVEEGIPGTANPPDYDYNDFAGQFRAVEIYKDPQGDSNNSGLLLQINLTVYAQACSVVSPNQWQLNVDADMPLGTEIQALVNLYNNTTLKSSSQEIYYSESGFSIPIFQPLDDALVYPDGYTSVNCDPWNYEHPQFVEGDYAEIQLTLGAPVGTGGYTPWPYVPVMWISPDGVNAYPLNFWKEKGDDLNTDGKPQAMLMPDTFAWPLEGKDISGVYAGFDTWIDWLNDNSLYEPLYPWYDDDPYVGEDPLDKTTWKAFSMDKFE